MITPHGSSLCCPSGWMRTIATARGFNTSHVPIITVLMPVFNGEKYLRQAIDSVLSQTLRDFEFWIIDDKARSKERVRYWNHIKIGEYGSFGTTRTSDWLQALMSLWGIFKPSILPEWIQDDISLPKRFEKQVPFHGR